MKKSIIAMFALAFASSAFADWHVTAGPKFSRIKLYNSASTIGGFVEAGYSFGWLSLDLGYDKLGSVTKDFYGVPDTILDFGDWSSQIKLSTHAYRMLLSGRTPAFHKISATLSIGAERRSSTIDIGRVIHADSINPIGKVSIQYAATKKVKFELGVSFTSFNSSSVYLGTPPPGRGAADWYPNFKKTAQLVSIEPSVCYQF